MSKKALFKLGQVVTTVNALAFANQCQINLFTLLQRHHLGDWGTQFGKLIVGYNNWLDQEAYGKEAIEELERIYVEFSNRAEENPELEDLAREELVKLQQGDEKNSTLWKEFIKI